MKNLSLPCCLLSLLLALLPLSCLANTILIFGDSLSAAYGMPVQQSWPTLLQQQLHKHGKKYQVINASVSGETSLGGKQRFAAALKQHRPNIVILELGANDGLRGQDLKTMQHNLAQMIEQAQKQGSQVLLIGMKIPPNYGPAYTRQFENSYTQLAKQYQLPLLPFLLANVKPEQFQADNLHPSAAAQPQLMQDVWQVLKPMLR